MRLRHWSLALVFWAIWMQTGTTMAEEPIFPPSGALQPVTADDFWHHERPQKTYGEYWYYEIHTDSGYRFFVNFLKTNIGLREGRCGANISIVKPGSPPRVFAREKPLKRFHEFKDKEQIWCSNPDNPEAEQTYIEGIPPKRHAIHLEIRKSGGVKLDLEFGRMVPGVKEGNGTYYFNKDKSDELAVFFTIPRARVKGTLTLGKHSFNVTGWAYHEHSYQTMLPTMFIARRVGFHTHTNDYSFNVMQLVGNKKYGRAPAGWMMVVDKDKVRYITRDFVLNGFDSQKEKGGYGIDSRFTIQANDTQNAIAGEWKLTNYMQRFVMLDQMERVMRSVVKSIAGNPIFFRGENTYSFKIKLGDETFEMKGDATHEVLAADK